MAEQSTTRLPLHESLPLAALLFVFWIILSGKTDLFHLAAGAVSALGIASASCLLYAATPPIGPRNRHPFVTLPWLRLAAYMPWLSWQIVVASFQVAQIVLRPKIDIDPKLIRFQHNLPHNLARATLANSITLTPGTVTIDVRADEYLVHSLTEESADALLDAGPGNMKERVGRVFRDDKL